MSEQMTLVSKSETSPELTRKKRRIFAMINDAGLTKEELDDNLPVWCGRNSIRLINEKEADLIITALGRIGKVARMQPKQFGKIKALQSKLNWDDKSLTGFISHTVGIGKKMSNLTLRDASKVILGLTKLTGRKS